jgi:hypothetical protein
MYELIIPYTQFREYLCENITTSQFNRYVDDEGNIEIEYTYGDSKNGKTCILFKIPGVDKQYTVMYTGSSRFALWWCGLTDDIEGED